MTKQDLTAALDIKKDLDRIETRLSEIKVTGGVRSSLRSYRGSGGYQDNAVVIAGELAEEAAELRGRLEQAQNNVRHLLDKMKLNVMERRLMILRYVECWGWQDVAARMAYSRASVMNKHAEILKRIE